MTSDLLHELKECLDAGGRRFSNYQTIPAFVREKLGDELAETDYDKRQLELDAPRFSFLTEYLDTAGMRVIEIGSSLGYFGLSLSRNLTSSYVGYEPIECYAAASGLLARASGLADRCEFHGRPVELADIPTLDQADLVVELNVLHHAGAVFDIEVAAGDGWRNYAISRLGALREKGRYLFFQTGNVRDGAALFPTVQTVTEIRDILVESGWKPLSVGVIEDLENLAYARVGPDECDEVVTYECRRNPDTNLVEYRCRGELVASLQTGLANRPIWICERTG